MFIKSLLIRQFRNYERVELEFDERMNVFIGENAQGKTNTIEAIYVLALAKSHRTSKDKELIRWNDEFAKVQGQVQRQSGPIELDLVISTKGKKVKLNGLEQRKLSEYVGAVNVVMFAPEDLNLVKGSPQLRRRFIDMELGQISPVYLHHLGLYQKVLQQRNFLLKDLQIGKGSKDMLDILTDQLIELAVQITKRRFVFLGQLQKWAEEIHRDISRAKETLKIIYKPSCDVLEEMDMPKMKEVFIETYENKKQREIARGVTLFGPHRDDLGFLVNEHDVQTYGSQGQQRTTALSVKLAEIELIHAEVGEYPILLLDDVLSELDDYRQTHLLHTIGQRVQTFVTTTSITGVHHEALDGASIFKVEQGTISNDA
ncbi:recombination protein F [Alkalihalophilus pseudofirmus OF4]|uniref:DNA replication and repair protein RecF n=1 Tax=Alkalihalophilus pseudofirmus (strain ATCC BAA-2126 / JCM 17055 / OF4) TaxID=398511 RepID=D3FQI0_ALKPO|nr:DNA replication/repair protein RecF [Alkalihalophilus pseudofirmus]ADC49652.1 recombination protein F [Alkalihalophilus pseudofirmus OF4]